MTSDFLRALDSAAAAGRQVPVWLRDDDATIPTPALERLLTLPVPMTLAVIPRDTTAELARRLHDTPHVHVAVHGWAHENHTPPPGKKQELGADRPAQLVLAELAQGQARLAELYESRLVPMLVPPWNRIAPGVAAGLPDLGFMALSTFGAEKPGPVPALNTHVDPIDWHGSRSLCPEPALWRAAALRVDEVARTGHGTLGLLTHHLQHDEAIWNFVAQFIALTRGHPACRWISSARAITSFST